MNHIRTFILIAALTALFMGVGYLIGGPTGMAIAFAFAAVGNLISYWNADKIVLGMYHAEEVDETHPDPRVKAYAADIAEMAAKAGLPRPRITLIPSDQPNAFATGRDPRHAAVAASTGLLALLTRREVRAVMGHELAHVKNRDTLTMTITATLAGAIGALANFAFFFGGNRDRESGGGLIGTLAIMILAPLMAGLVQFAISRGREYEADAHGAEISGDPEALASALSKIESYARRGARNIAAERNPATAHLFIINPLLGKGADNLFSTHPATQNRIAALMKLSGGARAPALDYGDVRPASGPAITAVPATKPRAARPKGPWG